MSWCGNLPLASPFKPFLQVGMKCKIWRFSPRLVLQGFYKKHSGQSRFQRSHLGSPYKRRLWMGKQEVEWVVVRNHLLGGPVPSIGCRLNIYKVVCGCGSQWSIFTPTFLDQGKGSLYPPNGWMHFCRFSERGGISNPKNSFNDRGFQNPDITKIVLDC